ncbi:MAG: amino acid-binding protein [Firmicutes bacterium]|nr:amino acid-binding protein [Bacillota bacterium]
MLKSPHFYIVEAAALPEIFHKVVEARRLLDTGEVDTVNRAVQMMGISRSAFYKYKDSVRPLQDMLQGRIISFQVIMKDEPGVLSSVLNIFGASGGNILTINQGIPVNGCAVANFSVESSGLQISINELLEQLTALPGVLRSEILAG